MQDWLEEGWYGDRPEQPELLHQQPWRHAHPHHIQGTVPYYTINIVLYLLYCPDCTVLKQSIQNYYIKVVYC